MFSSKLLKSAFQFRIYSQRGTMTIKNARLLNPLRPKTPDDDYRDLFDKTMSDHFKKELEKLERRTWKTWRPKKPCKDKPEKNDCIEETKCGQVKDAGKMRALVLDVPCREISLENVPIPNTLKKNEVSIQVSYAAGNLTDLYVMEGKIPSDQKTIIPGRELSGVVFGIGEEVENVKVGDDVVVAPCQPNTLCPYCFQQGLENCIKDCSGKSYGINRNGGWAQYTVLPAGYVYKICGVPMDKAALLPVLAQVMCAMNTMKIADDSHVLIQGCGLAGMIFALLLFDKGLQNVFILEDNPKRVQAINSMETGYTVLNSENLQCQKFDVIFCNGSGAHVMKYALNFLNTYGHFYVFGQSGQNGMTPLLTIDPREMTQRLWTLKGLTGTPANPTNVPIELANKILDCTKIGVPTVCMDNYNEALTQLTLGEISALIFKMKN